MESHRPLSHIADSAAAGAPFVAALLRLHGSDSGATQASAWRLDAAGHLMPDRAVRERFEELLSALNEATHDEVRVVLRMQVREEAGEPAVAQALQLWQQFLQWRDPAAFRHEQPCPAQAGTGWNQVLFGNPAGGG